MFGMGQNNRQRRAAKQRQRGRERTRRPAPRDSQNGAGPNDLGPLDLEALSVSEASSRLSRVMLALVNERPPGTALQEFRACAVRHQQAAVDREFSLDVDHVIRGRWTPLDLYEITRKEKLSAASHLLDIVATATAQHPERLVHPQWRAQLDQLGASAPGTGGVSPSSAWAEREGLDWPTASGELLALLAVVSRLPRIHQVLPAPGETATEIAGADGVDSKVLRRVRGLLAKAESTEHPEEADALTAKAQELMTRYSIERAVAESAQPVASVPLARRLWLESPYVDAKSLLVNVVADANNCQAIQSITWGFVTIVGHRGDLDLVELLVTSLLVQATRAMALAGPQVTRYGTSSTRSWRKSFLVAYASRIGERLRESVHTSEATYDSDHGGALVPVLAARREAVHEAMSEMFPDVVERPISVSNRAGYGAGRAAADLAQLNVRTPVANQP
jgi:hypothetical protein